MKAKLEKLGNGKSQALHCYAIDGPTFDFYWHYHPEYELTYIISGEGKRIVGTSYELFSAGDLVLLGPNLPHTWVSSSRKQRCQAVVIQFLPLFIEPFLQYDEFREIRRLLTKSEKGLRFFHRKKSEVPAVIGQLPLMTGGERLIKLVEVFLNLADLRSVQLNSESLKPFRKPFDQRRINKVFQYVQNGYRHELVLHKAAHLVHLSESAFCKYFKRTTGKTFSDYVNEIRIAHACQMLIETEWPVAQVAFDAGFSSLTYFNRVFSKKKGVTPREFRQIRS